MMSSLKFGCAVVVAVVGLSTLTSERAEAQFATVPVNVRTVNGNANVISAPINTRDERLQEAMDAVEQRRNDELDEFVELLELARIDVSIHWIEFTWHEPRYIAGGGVTPQWSARYKAEFFVRVRPRDAGLAAFLADMFF